MSFRNALQPLVRMFRDSRDEVVRLTAVDAIADIGNLEAGHFMLDVVRRERGLVHDRALVRLRSFPMGELAATVRHVAAIESGPVRRALEELTGSSFAARPGLNAFQVAGPVSAAGPSFRPRGSSTVKVDPWSGVLRTEMFPPCARRIWEVM